MSYVGCQKNSIRAWGKNRSLVYCCLFRLIFSFKTAVYVNRMVVGQILVWCGLPHKMADSTLWRTSHTFLKCPLSCDSKAILNTFRELLALMHRMVQKLPVRISANLYSVIILIVIWLYLYFMYLHTHLTYFDFGWAPVISFPLNFFDFRRACCDRVSKQMPVCNRHRGLCRLGSNKHHSTMASLMKCTLCLKKRTNFETV